MSAWRLPVAVCSLSGGTAGDEVNSGSLAPCRLPSEVILLYRRPTVARAKTLESGLMCWKADVDPVLCDAEQQRPKTGHSPPQSLASPAHLRPLGRNPLLLQGMRSPSRISFIVGRKRESGMALVTAPKVDGTIWKAPTELLPPHAQEHPFWADVFVSLQCIGLPGRARSSPVRLFITMQLHIA
ncbi:hypothetical protein BKA66DRAFT_74166 [Pyrenochaeta sp. MPI-SDFR-AT-0127]|nr:hypothetical protein BKA66DRAFT_74166 [Pyrenochaeta sp. MPI-SDFR-AT-0127]